MQTYINPITDEDTYTIRVQKACTYYFYAAGTFDDCAVTLGYIDEAGAFVPFIGADGNPATLTDTGGFEVVAPPSGLLAALVEEGEGTTATAAATLLLNPEGDDNDILLTVDDIGAEGNALTGEIVLTEDSTALTAVKTGNDIVVTSGDKRRMIVTGTLTDGTDPVVFPPLIFQGQFNDSLNLRRPLPSSPATHTPARR
jgi:hypothetical protein